MEVGSYVLWLSLVAALGMMPSSSMFDWIRGSSVPASLFVFWPMMATVFALALSLCALSARKGERGFVATSNLLMVILWASSVVAPN